MMEEEFLCSIALFDEETTNRFIELKKHYCKDNCDNIPPHITLGMYVDINENELVEWTKNFCKNHKSISINFNHIGLFGEYVCFLAPRVDENLLKLHYDYHQKFDDNCGQIGYNYSLKSDNWTPHSTIAMSSRDNISEALPIFQSKFEPFIGRIEKIAIYHFSPITKVDTFNLQ